MEEEIDRNYFLLKKFQKLQICDFKITAYSVKWLQTNRLRTILIVTFSQSIKKDITLDILEFKPIKPLNYL